MLFKSLPLLLISCVSCTAGMGPIISPGTSLGGSGGSATNVFLGVTSPLTAVTNAAGSWTVGLSTNDTRALTLTNAANDIWGVFVGNGANLNSLNASAMASGTAPVARLPMATSNTEGIVQPDNSTITITNGVISASVNQQAIFYNLPTVTVQCHGIATGGTISNNGAMFGPDTPGTKTCGIQEALNYILNTNDTVQPTVTGGIVQLYPGFYFPSVTIYTPTNLANYTPTNLQTLILRGAGEQSTFIVYSNTTPANLLVLGAGRPATGSIVWNTLNFIVRDIAFSSLTNACTNLLYVNGNNGGVFKSDIQNCWFENWGFITNTGYNYTGNLCPINIQENFGGDETHIDNCQFYFVDSIYWATDHGNISRTFYAGTGINNQWPLTSPFSVGAAVILGEPSSGFPNGNENWVFEKSYLDGNGPGITFLDTRLSTPNKAVVMSRDDASEAGVLKFLTLSNSTCAWQCQNPYPYGTNYMVMTNSSGNWVVTSVQATNVFFGYSGMFSGNGAGLTNLPLGGGYNVPPWVIFTNGLGQLCISNSGSLAAPMVLTTNGTGGTWLAYLSGESQTNLSSVAMTNGFVANNLAVGGLQINGYPIYA